jgi:hypothetical protein
MVTDISSLQSELTWWEWFDYGATLVVFVGVLGELLAEFTNGFKTDGNKKREKRFTLVFTIILLVGLAGELNALIRTSALTGQITTTLRNDITAAYKSFGDAAVEASRANERAQQIEQENLRLKIELEKERRARAKVTAAIAPRRLTPEQQKAITEAVRPFAKPGVKIVVRYTLGTGRVLGTQVWNALHDAGFDVVDEPYGLGWYELAVSGPFEYRDTEEAIVRALLQKGNLPMEGVIQISPPGSPIVITVGERSQGELPK